MSDPEGINTLIDAEPNYPEQPIVRYPTRAIIEETLELHPPLLWWVRTVEETEATLTATEEMLVGAIVRQQNLLCSLANCLARGWEDNQGTDAATHLAAFGDDDRRQA